MSLLILTFSFFFFNDTATTEIYTLSLHDALPILGDESYRHSGPWLSEYDRTKWRAHYEIAVPRSEEHTSELQSHSDLVCRLLLEKKKKTHTTDKDPARYVTTRESEVSDRGRSLAR